MGPNEFPDIEDVANAARAGSKVLAAIGKVFPGWAANSLGKAESRETDRILNDLGKIKAQQNNLGLADETVSELMTNAVRRHNRNVNFNGIVKLATSEISDEANPGDIDPEWAENFRDHAEKVSTKEVQQVWAKMLAGEINKPGSFSKRTMSILADMSAYECEAFAKLCSFSIASPNSNMPPLVVLYEKKDVPDFNDGAFTYDERSSLEALGLIDCGLIRNLTLEKGGKLLFNIGSLTIEITNNTDSKRKLGFSPLLTRFGCELASICKLGNGNQLHEYLTAMAIEQGFDCESKPAAPSA